MPCRRRRLESHVLPPLWLGLEKKLELDELARARSSSARLGPARRSERARAEPVFLAREKSEPARLGSVQLASWLVARSNNNLLHKILISSSSTSWLGLAAARLGSDRLDAPNEPEPSLFFWLVKRASQLGSARCSSRAGSWLDPTTICYIKS